MRGPALRLGSVFPSRPEPIALVEATMSARPMYPQQLPTVASVVWLIAAVVLVMFVLGAVGLLELLIANLM